MPTAPAIVEARIRRVDGEHVEAVDTLAIEEPLEIRLSLSIDGKRTRRPISVTMRTPGNDDELAAGFLFTESIVSAPDQITRLRHWPVSVENKNTIIAELADDVDVDLDRLQRHFYTSSSCGVCGKSSIEAVSIGAPRVTSSLTISAETISRLPTRLRATQIVFESTGGLHAAALFTAEGDVDILREDVGRHNALDKVIGAKFLAGEVPLSDRLLLVSGRASFELVQKALIAGIPVLAAVGAPSSLAVELAKEFGMTLIGFLRDGRFNIYCGEQRVI